MVTRTLKRMGEGGIYDQVGGGFSRYSVDQYWMIPHFEKMLYDNGPLLALYAHTATATGDHFFADVASGIANWVLREMQSAQGGYYSSLDADSEGHEGRFYVWDKKEIQSLLDRSEYQIVERRFDLCDELGRHPDHDLATRLFVERRQRVDQLIDPDALSRPRLHADERHGGFGAQLHRP